MTREDFELQTIHTISTIAGQLAVALIKCSDNDELTTPKPERLAELAEEIFNAAFSRLACLPADRPRRTRIEQFRLIRLIKKLRANTLDSEERVEFAELVEKGI